MVEAISTLGGMLKDDEKGAKVLLVTDPSVGMEFRLRAFDLMGQMLEEIGKVEEAKPWCTRAELHRCN